MMNVSWLDWAGGYTIHNISTAANCGPGQLGLLPRTLPNTVSYYIDQFCCIYLFIYFIFLAAKAAPINRNVH